MQIDFVEGLVSAFWSFLMKWAQKGGEVFADVLTQIAELTVWTPHPKFATPTELMTRPSSPIWGQIWDLHWGLMVPLGLAIIWGSYFARSAGKTFNLVSAEAGARSRKSAVKGSFILLFSWWLIALYLNFVNGLAYVLVPDIAEMQAAIPDLSITAGAVSIAFYFLEINLNITLLILLLLVNIVRLIGAYTFGMVGGLALAVSYSQIPILSGSFEKAFNKMAVIPLWALPVAASWRIMVVLSQANNNGGILSSMLPGGIMQSIGSGADAVVTPLLTTIPLIVGLLSPLIMSDVQQLYYMKQLSGLSIGNDEGQYVDRDAVSDASGAVGGAASAAGGAAGAAGKAAYEGGLSEQSKLGIEKTKAGLEDQLGEVGAEVEGVVEDIEDSVDDVGLFADDSPGEGFDMDEYQEEVAEARREALHGNIDPDELEEEFGAAGLQAAVEEFDEGDQLNELDTTEAGAWDATFPDADRPEEQGDTITAEVDEEPFELEETGADPETAADPREAPNYADDSDLENVDRKQSLPLDTSEHRGIRAEGPNDTDLEPTPGPSEQGTDEPLDVGSGSGTGTATTSVDAQWNSGGTGGEPTDNPRPSAETPEPGNTYGGPGQASTSTGESGTQGGESGRSSNSAGTDGSRYTARRESEAASRETTASVGEQVMGEESSETGSESTTDESAYETQDRGSDPEPRGRGKQEHRGQRPADDALSDFGALLGDDE